MPYIYMCPVTLTYAHDWQVQAFSQARSLLYMRIRGHVEVELSCSIMSKGEVKACLVEYPLEKPKTLN